MDKDVADLQLKPGDAVERSKWRIVMTKGFGEQL